MKRMIAALALCSSALPGMAQLKAAAPQAPPVDLSASSLPGGFPGYDCTAITKRLKDLKISKDEFESSADYIERTSALLQARLSGEVTGVDPMVFVAQVQGWGARYDADSGFLSVSLSFSPNVMNSDAKLGLVAGEVVADLGTTSRSYVGTNGYGAKATVTEFTTTVCAVGFKNVGYAESVQNRYRFQVKMDGQKAKAVKDRLHVALVGALVPPFVGTYVTSSTATVQNPQSMTRHGDAAIIRLDEVWLFDKATGEVFDKVSKPSKF